MADLKTSEKKTLLIRAVSAVAAVVFVVSPYLLFGNSGLKVTIWLASLLSLREVDRLLMLKEDGPMARGALALTCLLIWILAETQPQQIFPIFILAGILIYIILQWIHRNTLSAVAMRSLQMRAFLAVFYMGSLPAIAQLILNLPSGDAWFFSTLVLVFSGDTMAYLVGVTFGKTKMIPIVSPKKSYQGSLGGILGTLIAAAVTKPYLPEMSWELWLLFSFVLAITAQFGDFFESLLKRAVDTKDSGTLLPGHGGVLDRIDGVLFALPAIYFLASSL